MINHVDYLADARQARVTLSCQSPFAANSRAGTQPGRQGELSDVQLESMTSTPAQMMKCQCGRRHLWGGPVCGVCFVAAPERVQTDYLIGTLERRQAAVRWLAGFALLRAARPGGMPNATEPAVSPARKNGLSDARRN